MKAAPTTGPFRVDPVSAAAAPVAPAAGVVTDAREVEEYAMKEVSTFHHDDYGGANPFVQADSPGYYPDIKSVEEQF